MNGSPIGLLLALTYGTPAPAVVGPGVILDGATPDRALDGQDTPGALDGGPIDAVLAYSNEATLTATRTDVILENEIT